MADRPKVGAADPETLRKKLREALDQSSRPTGVAPRPSPAPAPKKTPTRRYGPKGETLDEIERGAVSGRQSTDHDY